MGRPKKIKDPNFLIKRISGRELIDSLLKVEWGSEKLSSRYKFIITHYSMTLSELYDKKSIVEEITANYSSNSFPIAIVISDKVPSCQRGIETSFLYKINLPMKDVATILKYYFLNSSVPISSRYFTFNCENVHGSKEKKLEFWSEELALISELNFTKIEIVERSLIASYVDV